MSILIGVILGLLSGLGVGGGSLLILYLIEILGYNHLDAALINLLFYICTAFPALILHTKNRLVYYKATIYCVLSGVLFSVLGAFLANNIDTDILKKLFGGFLIIVGANMLFSSNEKT